VAYKQKTELNEDAVLDYLRDAVARIKTEEDPLELNQYRRLFRKGVPFTLRSYFAAYVLKQIDNGAVGGGSSRQGKRNRKERPLRDERPAREERPSREERPGREKRGENAFRNESPEPRKERQGRDRGDEPKRDRQERQDRQSEPRQRPAEPRTVLPDDVSTTLFVSIGRNRRVYPRDLIGLILQTTGLEREHIGEIRVLDNYSFVQVITEDAEKIIATLNETEYRGRKLTVSFSKKREEAPASRENEAEDSEGFTDGSEPVDSYAETEGSMEESFDAAPVGAGDEAADSFESEDDGPEAAESETDPAGLADSEENRDEIH